MTQDDATDALIERMRMQADLPADRAIAAILGPWQADAGDAVSGTALLAGNPVAAQRLAILNRLLQQWSRNADVTDWQPPPDTPPEVALPLAAFLAQAAQLPAWADRRRIARAETVFAEHGVMTCTLLFCASLPQCYVVPDLAQTLHATGQLERHTDHRIRATAAMIFPVLMQGGLTSPDGSGMAQVLKVRLIHATIRYLVLRGDTAGQLESAPAMVALPRLPEPARTMHETLLAHGWDTTRDGLPCNQQEMAYTLLTFHLVFLRGMRRLGLRLGAADEEAYLHAWNVVGHLIGVAPALVATTVKEAGHLFDRLQALGRQRAVQPDPRPPLTAALMGTMQNLIPLHALKQVPPLLTLFLCGRRSAHDIGLTTRFGWGARCVFFALIVAVRTVDAVLGVLRRHSRVARFLLRVMGRRFIEALLLDQTRPLVLPGTVTAQLEGTAAQWRADPRAPRWLNRWEEKLMSRGSTAALAAVRRQ